MDEQVLRRPLIMMITGVPLEMISNETARKIEWS